MSPQKVILLCVAKLKNVPPLNLEHEIHLIQESLSQSLYVLNIQIGATPDQVQKALLEHRPVMVHFCGYGKQQEGITLPQELGWEPLLHHEEDLSNFLEFFTQVECIVLNAGHTLIQASALVKTVPYVIGINQPLSEHSALQFVVEFYRALAGGKSYVEAFERYKSLTPFLILKQKRDFAQQFWFVPLLRNPYFAGREQILREILETLVLHQTIALSGPGGVGKTQLAVELAYQHRHEYQAVLWSLADSQETLNLGMAALAEVLQLPKSDTQEKTLTLVKQWFEHHQDWLLILDNVEDIKLIEPWLPQHQGGSLLITTRVVTHEYSIQHINISSLALYEATKLLWWRVTGQAMGLQEEWSPEGLMAYKLAKELGGLPLALAQAGAYIHKTGCGFADYRQRSPKHFTSNHPKSVVMTWRLSFEKIAQTHPFAIEILKIAAFLHPDQIPEEIFASDYPIEFEEALTTILSYSLMQWDSHQRMLAIHRSVQLVLQEDMTKTEQQYWFQEGVKRLDQLFPNEPNDLSKWPLCERLLLCSLHSVTLVEQWELEFLEAAQLFNKVAHYLETAKADYAQAKPLLEQALGMREKLLGTEHPETAESLHHLAWWYEKARGDYVAAKPLYERALTIYEKVLGPQHPNTAESLNSLAFLYFMQGDYSTAKLLYDKALMICEKFLGPQHPHTAQSLNNLAKLYYAQSDYASAQPLYQRALAIYEQVLGAQHPHTAQSLNNLAKLYYEQGKYTAAKPLLKRALSICEKVLGAQHPQTALSLHNLAMLYCAQGKYTAAQLLYERALTIVKNVFDTHHPAIQAIENNYQELLSKMAEPKKSVWKRMWSLLIFQKILK